MASIRLVRPTERIIYDVTRKNLSNNLIHHAGYHFSYFGDIEYKLKSWGHAGQFNRPPYNDPEHIKTCKEQGLDFLQRKGSRKIEFEFTQDLSYLPEYVLNNMNKYNNEFTLLFMTNKYGYLNN
jgi:hypothetical protein